MSPRGKWNVCILIQGREGGSMVCRVHERQCLLWVSILPGHGSLTVEVPGVR